MSDGPSFTQDTVMGRVVFGTGAARRALAAEVDALGGRRVLVVTTERGAAAAGELVDGLGDRVVGLTTRVREHVPVEIADEVRLLAAELQADLLLAVGGGSSTGMAKAVALTSGLPIAVVPTTYAGSEATAVWGLTVDGRKTTGHDPRVRPRTVIYDPELTRSLPAAVSVTSAMNAMAHAVEAFWAAGTTPVATALAERSIGELAAGLPGVVTAPDNVAARSQVLLGAWLAGLTLAIAGTGLHHKLCHVFGGSFGLPHAATHTVLLPQVLAFNAPYAPEAAARVARALGAADAVSGLRDLLDRLDAPRSLAALGLAEADLPRATDLAVDVVPADNPRPAGRDAIGRLLRAAWAGTVDATEVP